MILINKSQRCVLICAMLALPVLLSAQATWHVAPPPAGRDDGTHSGLDWLQPFATISNAVVHAALNNGDLIRVTNDTYDLTAHVDVNKGVTIRSWNAGAVDRDGTIINGGGAVRGFYIRHTNAVVQGFTITNGYPTNTTLGGYGGGVYLNGGRLHDCLITGNRVGLTGVYPGRGGGIYQGDSSASLISNCIVRGNNCVSSGSVGAGGGVFLHNGAMVDGWIENNGVTTYGTADFGGGVQLASGTTLTGCIVVSNTAGDGAGVWVSGINNIMSNCIVIGNDLWGMGLGGNAALRAYGLTVSSNTAGGISSGGNDSVLDCYDSTIDGNTGCVFGAIMVRGWGMISNCNIRYNSGGGVARGALNFYRTATIGPGSGTATHCRVIGNVFIGDGTQDSDGAGIRVGGNSYGVLIKDCEIRDNILSNASRAYGGGMNISSNVVVRNTLVTGNWAYGVHVDADKGGVGAGIYIAAGASNRVESCTITDNHAKRRGGGVYIAGAGTDQVVNTIVYSNTAGDGLQYADWQLESTARKTNVSYTCTPDADGTWGAGCTSANPLFADPGNGDYRPQFGSPCINAGLNQDWMPGALDLVGRPRLDRIVRWVDMGCYEYIPQGTFYYVR